MHRDIAGLPDMTACRGMTGLPVRVAGAGVSGQAVGLEAIARHAPDIPVAEVVAGDDGPMGMT